jgi:prepilin-type N-terminal cleavage/methylation domain-containing protein
MLFKLVKNKRGFTLIELMVTVSIFVFMTALMLAKYGNFNQSVLLTNLAYDVALTVRMAQTYGLSVQGQSQNFQYAYGIDFCGSSAASDCKSPNTSNQQIVLFIDRNSNGVYDLGDLLPISTYNIKRGATVSQICISESDCSGNKVNYAGISFMRPNPDAIICASGSCSITYIKITVQATDGNTRNIVVRHTGQVSVEN